MGTPKKRLKILASAVQFRPSAPLLTSVPNKLCDLCYPQRSPQFSRFSQSFHDAFHDTFGRVDQLALKWAKGTDRDTYGGRVHAGEPKSEVEKVLDWTRGGRPLREHTTRVISKGHALTIYHLRLIGWVILDALAPLKAAGEQNADKLIRPC